MDDKFVADVRVAFAKLAADYLAKAEKYGKKLDAALRKKVVDVINAQIDGEGGPTMREHAKLGKDERKALVGALANDVMLSEQGRVGALMNNFAKQVELKAEAFRRSAHRTVDNPLGAQTIFPTDTEGNPALSNEFRDLARACVKAACETREFRGLVKKIDKDLGI